MDFSHISEVDVEEGIRQEAEQRARERDEMRGMDAEDIFTPSPDEPTPPFCSSSESESSFEAWRRRGREAKDRIEEDIAAADAHDLSQTLAELVRALALSGQEERHWEEHSEHLQEQVDQEAAGMTQLEIEIAHSIEQIFEQAELEEVTLIGSAETSEAEAPEEAEIIESSPEESCVELGGEVEVCFVFYLLQASGSSWQSRRNQGQGWLRQETPQLQAGMTL